MACTGKVYGGSNNNVTVLLQNDRLTCTSEVLNSLWIPTSSPSFHGSKSMLSFETEAAEVSFLRQPGNNKEETNNGEGEEEEEECYDGGGGCIQPAGKKRRLTASQVQFLEKSFEVENKLEPERKGQLAKDLGLQPRQVAIWFQNRRARFKTKQLEKDFGVLRATFDRLKSDYDDLLKQNEALKLEVDSLKGKLGGKEKGNEGLELENGISTSSVEEPQNPIVKAASLEGVSNVPILVCKQEDASSAKSDVFDSDDSPHCAENNYSSLVEPEQSDFSQDEEEDLIMRKTAFLPAPPSLFLPKLADCCYDDPPAAPCNLGFTAVEDQPFNFWPY